MLVYDCCFRPLARKALQMPPSEDPASLATSLSDPARRQARALQAQHGTSQSFHPAASSFAASAVNSAAALGSTLREASSVLHERHSHVLLCSLSRHACSRPAACKSIRNQHVQVRLAWTRLFTCTASMCFCQISSL